MEIIEIFCEIEFMLQINALLLLVVIRLDEKFD